MADKLLRAHRLARLKSRISRQFWTTLSCIMTPANAAAEGIIT
jgi:hypothetical protein